MANFDENDAPALWNPKAAIWLSALLLPLGPILHHLNWKALGKDKEAKKAKEWAIGFCVAQIISFLPFIPPVAGYSLIGVWLVWGWGLFSKKTFEKAREKGQPMATGKEQVDYVAEKYGTEYKRKSWLVPGIAVACYMLPFFALGVLDGLDEILE